MGGTNPTCLIRLDSIPRIAFIQRFPVLLTKPTELGLEILLLVMFRLIANVLRCTALLRLPVVGRGWPTQKSSSSIGAPVSGPARCCSGSDSRRIGDRRSGPGRGGIETLRPQEGDFAAGGKTHYADAVGGEAPFRGAAAHAAEGGLHGGKCRGKGINVNSPPLVAGRRAGRVVARRRKLLGGRHFGLWRA